MKNHSKMVSMRKSILFLFFMAARVHAQELCEEDTCCLSLTNTYVKVFSGVNFLQNTTIDENKSTYQTGYIVAGSLGYNFCYGLSLEAEYAFRRNEIREIHFASEGSSKSGYLQTSSYMGNLIWDVPLSLWDLTLSGFNPFIGVGFGYDVSQMQSSNSRIVFNQDWDQFSWQLMCGVAYKVFRDIDIDLEYKYHASGCQFHNHSVGIGLRYKFGFLR